MCSYCKPLFSVCATAKSKVNKKKIESIEKELKAYDEGGETQESDHNGRPEPSHKRHISFGSDFITQYCYSEEERLQAIADLGPDPEITRFKGLGEISPDEFKNFIGTDMRLEKVTLSKSDQVAEMLEYYMGKNTMERQNFIIDNLVIEEDIAEDL